MTALEQQLAELPGMSPAQLRAKWRDCWRKPAPDIGPDLLRRGIAWKLQSRVHGDLPSHIKRELERAAERLRRGEELVSRADHRSSRGRGLCANGRARCTRCSCWMMAMNMMRRRFNSLTQIATAITGTHWSGPNLLRLEEAEASLSSGQ